MGFGNATEDIGYGGLGGVEGCVGSGFTLTLNNLPFLRVPIMVS